MSAIKKTGNFFLSQLLRPYTEVGKSVKNLSSTSSNAVKQIKADAKTPFAPLDQIAQEGLKIKDPKARFAYHQQARQRSDKWLKNQLRNCRIGHAGTLFIAFVCLIIASSLIIKGINTTSFNDVILGLMFMLGTALSGIKSTQLSIYAYQIRHKSLVGWKEIPFLTHLTPWADN